MRDNKKNNVWKKGLVVSLAVFSVLVSLTLFPAFVQAQASVPGYQYDPFSYYGSQNGQAVSQYYFPTLDPRACEDGQGQDFIVEVLPGSCTPQVVRSDLLEEQPVTVFCRLTGIKVNPLIEVPQIKSINIAPGSLPQGIRSVLFHPYRAALRGAGGYVDLVGSPTASELGYAVIVLDRISAEKDMPEVLDANLTARITYDVRTTYGITNDHLVLPEMTDEEWSNNYKQYGFWDGKGYVRAIDVREGSAQIGVYINPDKALNTFSIQSGKSSPQVYMPGFYCSSGMEVKLEKVISPQDKAVLNIDGTKREVIEGSEVLDGRCEVISVDPATYGIGGKLKLRCDDGTHDLIRPGASASYKSKSDYAIGDVAVTKDFDGKNYSVVFIGKYLFAKEGVPDTVDLFVLKEIKGKVNVKELQLVNKNIGDVFAKKKFKDKTELIEEIKKQSNGLVVKTDTDGVQVSAIRQINYPDLVEYYYSLYKDSYRKVISDFPNEKNVQEGFYSQDVLKRAAEVAEQLGKDQDAIKILEEYVERFPDAKDIATKRDKLASFYSTGSSEGSTKIITTKGKTYYVVLESLSKPTEEELSVDLFVNGALQKASLGELVGSSGEASKRYWEVTEILEDKVRFKRLATTTEGETIQTINRGQKANLGNDEVVVEKINFKKFAVVSLHPFGRDQTYANFSVHIGIEKRGIKLSPDQTRDLINKLNKSITKLETLTEKLGNVVEDWKKVCLVGSAALWTYNFFDNIVSGAEAAARQFVMREQDLQGYQGRSSWCADKKNWGRDKLASTGVESDVDVKSFSECIFVSGDKIEKDIDIVGSIMENGNEVTKNLKEGATEKSGGFLGLFKTKQLDRNKLMGDIQTNVIDNYGWSGTLNGLKDGSASELSSQEVNNVLGQFSQMYKDGLVGFDDYSGLNLEVESFNQCKKSVDEAPSKGFCDGIQQKLFTRLNGYNDLLKVNKKSKETTGVINSLFKNVGGIPHLTNAQTVNAPVRQVKDLGPNMTLLTKHPEINEGDYVTFIDTAYTRVETVAQGTYVIVSNRRGGYFEPISEKIFKFDGKEFVRETDLKVQALIVSNAGKVTAAAQCSHKFSNPEIRFWGSGPFTGMPAVMPLGRAPDGTIGWYAATKPYGDTLLSGAVDSGSYTDAGEPTHFYIANVGGNEKVDFGTNPTSDDAACSQYFALTETYEGQTKLPGMTQAQTKQFVEKATRCLKEAAKSRKTPEGRSIGTSCGTYPVGDVKASAPGLECEDFMSAERCNLLYNMCDPVLCPPSRCDLGGRFPTDNVVQTGIIGSLVLCLPNYGSPNIPGVGTLELPGGREGGVAVPVCLTGVHAGLENLITVFKAVQGCLETSLETGRHVGICDQLQSVYLCEFFWRELTPFLRTGIPMLIERTVYNRKGGGEYLTFATAYDNSIKQAQYFTNYYGANALRAFQVRSTEEAGSLVCKAFVGLRYPNSASLLDELAKPESPPQINAWFDESSFSSVTVPPTSQYKVYWHIFAGKDEPSYWSVYLKSPSFSPGVNIPQQYVVQTGYTPKGEFSDVTRDFTAPSGYKEICVRLNLKEYCGFQKVNTGFAVEELTNYYVSSQTTPEYQITSEEECTSGKSSLWTAETLPEILTATAPFITQPGVGGLGETFEPSLYSRGVNRICSGSNPGQGSDVDRWDRVGFCDSDKKIGCWLDRKSVEGAISDLGLLNQTLSNSRSLSEALLANISGYKGAEESAAVLGRLKEGGKGSEISKVKNAIKAIDNSRDRIVNQRDKVDGEVNNILGNKTVRELRDLVEFSLSKQHRAEAQMHLIGIYEVIVLHFGPVVVSAVPEKTIEGEKKVEPEKPKESGEANVVKTEMKFEKGSASVSGSIIVAFEKAFADLKSDKSKILMLTGYRASDESPALSLERAKNVFDQLPVSNVEDFWDGYTYRDGGVGESEVEWVLTNCEIKSVNWEKTKAVHGEDVRVIAIGEGDCIGAAVFFDIKEGDITADDTASFEPLVALFDGNKIATAAFSVYYQGDEYGDPEYKAYAYLPLSSRVKSGELEVSKLADLGLYTYYVGEKNVNVNDVAELFGVSVDQVRLLNYGSVGDDGAITGRTNLNLQLTVDQSLKAPEGRIAKQS